VWLGTTGASLAWSARTEPRVYARVLDLVASMRNYTRRWAQSQ
jgi:hypothetical protein